MKPNKALVHFHQECCNDLMIDSPQVFYKLIEELQILKDGA